MAAYPVTWNDAVKLRTNCKQMVNIADAVIQNRMPGADAETALAAIKTNLDANYTALITDLP